MGISPSVENGVRSVFERALALSTGARLVALLASLALTGIAFRSLPGAELAIWFLCSQLSVVCTLFEFGRTEVVARRLAMLCDPHGRGSRLAAESVRRGDAAAYNVARWGYWRFFPLLLIVVFSLVLILAPRDMTQGRVLVVASLAALSSGLVYVAQGYSAIIRGTGRVGVDSLVVALFSLATSLVQCAAAHIFRSVESLFVVSLFANAATLLVLRRLALRYFDATLIQPISAGMCRLDQTDRRMALAFWQNSLLTNCVQRSQLFILSAFGMQSEIPKFSAHWAVFSAFAAIISQISSSSFPLLCQLEARGKTREASTIALSTAGLLASLYVVHLSSLSICGRDLFLLWLGPNFAFDHTLFVAMGALALSESLFVHFLRATRASGFARSDWLVGIGVVTLVGLLLVPPLSVDSLGLVILLLTSQSIGVHLPVAMLYFRKHFDRAALPVVLHSVLVESLICTLAVAVAFSVARLGVSTAGVRFSLGIAIYIAGSILVWSATRRTLSAVDST